MIHSPKKVLGENNVAVLLIVKLINRKKTLPQIDDMHDTQPIIGLKK